MSFPGPAATGSGCRSRPAARSRRGCSTRRWETKVRPGRSSTLPDFSARPPGHQCPGYVVNEKPAEAGSEVRAAHSGAGFTRLFGRSVARALMPGRGGPALRQRRGNLPMLKNLAIIPFLLLLALPAFAQPPAAAPAGKDKDAKAEEKKPQPPPEEKSSVTRHSLTLDGRTYPYTATAGTLLLRDDESTVKASVFYIAYTLDGVKDPATRPVTFSFNGGPGAASLWVHLGAFGPRRVARTDEGFGLPPPGKLVDNEDSILDTTDLVFIDPVSTGYSYGTTRAAGLAYQLAERYGMMLNGIVLVSTVLNWQDQDFHPGNERPCFIHLPTYAAAAWYHKKRPPELSGDLFKTLAEVETFALDEYGPALLQGDRLPEAKRKELAAKIARYAGLSPTYVERSNLCVQIDRFTKELLRDQGKTLGRLDTRFTGNDIDSVGENYEFDPASASTDGPFAAAINDYIRRDLKYETDLVYERLTDKVWPWDWTFHNQYVNVAEYLRQAITRNPNLKVLMAAGVYDLA